MLDSFNFEHRLIQRLEQLSELSDTLPESADLIPTPQVPFVKLDSQTNLTSTYVPATTDKESEPVDLTQTASHEIEIDGTKIWVQGNTILCACPDCQAPTSVRMWLGLADCWRCRTSIALSEKQIEAAEQLLEQSTTLEKSQTPHPPEILAGSAHDVDANADVLSPPAPLPYPGDDATPEQHVEFPKSWFPQVDVEEDAPEVGSRQRELERLTRGSLTASVLRRGFKITPAWMVSFLLHLIAILILALIVMSDDSNLTRAITLSTFLDSSRQSGGQFRSENPLDALQDDLELANQLADGDKELRKVLEKANQDARELVVDPTPRVQLPDIKAVKQNITTRRGEMMSFAARDPRVRAEIVKLEGGTTITEASVARGLRWMASVQNKDGSWSLKDYDNHKRENNAGDVMGTSLALLPMLGAGQTHEFGAYKQNVAAGLAWLVENQKPNGDLRAGYTGQAGMYAHGQAAIVLCEALALTGDQQLHNPALRAIKFIELAQHGKGGWRYAPGQVGDTSVFGWQMMALQSARATNLNIEIDEDTFKLADYFLDQVAAPARMDNRNRTELPDGAAYCYQPGRKATAAMTAEAILCRMYLGWKRRDPRLASAIKWLIADHLPSEDDKNLYYWYYGTQVMHHYGGDPWKIWNGRMRELLITTQETRGRHPGSWDPDDFEWGARGGRIYTTSLAVCTLEVYYRHLPIFKQIELDE